MTNRTERIAQELRRRIEASNFTSVTLTMKCNGDQIVIRPCGYDIKKFEDIEYYLVDNPASVWLDGDDLLKVAERLDKYAELIAERDNDITRLKKDILEHGYLEDGYVRAWVSDWYKELFGRRPKFRNEAEAIAWASR